MKDFGEGDRKNIKNEALLSIDVNDKTTYLAVNGSNLYVRLAAGYYRSAPTRGN